MSVYYSKSRKSWYIRYSWKGVLRYCYSAGSGLFVSHKAAADYEPVFVSSLCKASDGVVTCDDLVPGFSSYLSERIKPSSVYYRLCFFRKYVVVHFAGLSPNDVDDRFLIRLNRSLNHAPRGSVSGVIASARHWLRYLKRWNPLIPDNLVFKFVDARVHVTSYRIWSFSDEIRFLSSIEDDGDRFLFTLLVYYGLRIGEALALKWSDFRKNGLSISRAVCCKSGKGAVEFLTPKTKNSVRVLPILDVVKPFLDMAHSSVYCFPAREKGAVVLGETSVRRLNIRYADSCGLAPLKLHEFRHSCASNLLSQGLPLRVVARWLGDTEATVSSTYSHLLPDEKSLIKDYFDSQNGGKKVVKNKKKS